MSRHTKTALKLCAFLAVPLLLLYAIFYPVIHEITENAHTAHCQIHLKRLGVAFMQYSQDSDEMMPNISDRNGNTWREAISRYVPDKEVFHCVDRNDGAGSDGFAQSYAANYSGNYGRTQPDKGKGALAGPGSVPLAHKDYPTPGKLILLMEAENNNRPEFNIDDANLFGPRTHKLWAGHFRHLTNFLMADGHVKALPPATTYLYDPKNRSLFNFWQRNCETRLSANGVAVLKDTANHFR